MNERIERIALKAGLLNYVDNESPRHYFVRADINEEDIEMFAELIVRECAKVSEEYRMPYTNIPLCIALAIKEHFGVE